MVFVRPAVQSRKISRVREHSFARERIGFLHPWVHAGAIDGVPFVEDATPSAGFLDVAKVRPHFNVIRMQLRVFDREFSHVRQAAIRPVRLLRQLVVFADDVSLLVQ